jgi:hypothetical protein
MPANSVALRLYFTGLDRLRAFDYLGAKQVLWQPVTADPDDALTREVLSAS